MFTSCKKDGTPPEITVTGSSQQTVSLNGTYTDAGATAKDNHDAAIAATSDASATNPNVNVAGTYTITYTATDKAGNTMHATRTVIVKNDAAYLEGNYKVSMDNGLTWVDQNVSSSGTENKKIIISNFGGYTGNYQVTAIVQGSTVSLPYDETATGIGSEGCTHIFSNNGIGNYSSDSNGKYGFSIRYTDTQVASGPSCLAKAPTANEVYFRQQ
jgi:hypothetical protein